MAQDGSSVLDTSKATSAPPVRRRVEYNSRDLIIYALALGSRDPRHIYEQHSDFAAFPTYPIVLTYKGESYDTAPSWPAPMELTFAWPRFPGFRVGLDAGKVIERVKELPRKGANLVVEGSFQSVRKKSGGALVERLWHLMDDQGVVYYKMVDVSFLVGASGFTESGVTLSELAATPSDRKPTHSIEVQTTELTPALYRLSGDYNPLHIDPSVAEKAGFEKPILHGQCTMGIVTRTVLETVAKGDHTRFRQVQVRFSSPVIPGEALLVEVWMVSPTDFAFQAKVKNSGKTCISNGMLLLHPESRM